MVKNRSGYSGIRLLNWLYLSKKVKSYLKNSEKVEVTLIIFGWYDIGYDMTFYEFDILLGHETVKYVTSQD